MGAAASTMATPRPTTTTTAPALWKPFISEIPPDGARGLAAVRGSWRTSRTGSLPGKAPLPTSPTPPLLPLTSRQCAVRHPDDHVRRSASGRLQPHEETGCHHLGDRRG